MEALAQEARPQGSGQSCPELEASASQANSICHYPAPAEANAFRDLKPLPSVSEITLAKVGSENRIYDMSSEHSKPIIKQKEVVK